MRIGIVGGGQLGRMLALAAVPMGHEVSVLAQRDDEPACAVARPFLGAFDDEAVLARFVEHLDVVTYEFENIPQRTLRWLAARVPVRPGLRSLEVAADRASEKALFRELGIDAAPARLVDDPRSLEDAVLALGLPAILKTRRLGYDGKGQRVLRAPGDVAGAFEALGAVPSILEGFVPFTRELSILGVRAIDGAIATYPLVQNEHRDAILLRTDAPALGVSEALAARARAAITALLGALDHVGVLALELFEHDGRLLANEIAPRVHNSGHFSIEGAETSQFEAHVRAIVGDPIGSTALRRRSTMVNLVGALPPREALLEIPGAHLHLYGKTPRPGRKLGHVTIEGEDEAAHGEAVRRVLALVRGTGTA